jgi:glutathione S-transferase
MMILRSSLPSPFGRKVKIAAALLGLREQIEVVITDVTDPADAIRNQNPLGKIPALILESGEILYDSRVIIEYLDYLAGGNRLIPAPPQRFTALTRAALADGILDAALLIVYETRFRGADKYEPKWVDYQSGKIGRALAAFEAELPKGARDVSHIGLACALGYLDLRLEGRWRAEHPKLVAWFDAFAAEVPAFAATKFVQA